MLNGGDSLDRGVTDYRKQGLPWTSNEVDRDGPVVESENAAPILERAFIKFDATRASSEGSKAWTMVAEGDNEGAEAIVAHYAPELVLAKEAAQLPRADFHKDWDLGPEILFPETMSLRSLERLLSVRAVMEARRGEVAASNSDLKDAWALSRLAGQEPILISLLVQVSSRATILSAAEQAVSAYRSQPPALSLLKTLLAKMTDEVNFERAVRGEAYMGLVVLRNGPIFRSRLMHNSDTDSKIPVLDPRTLRRSGSPTGIIERFTGGKLLKSYVQLDSIARKDAGNSTQLDADLQAFDQELAKDNSLTAYYRNILLPVYSHIGQVISEDKARRVTMMALVGAMLKHAQTGRYPARISDISGTWIDPFDGKPLRLKVKGESIRIYSVGPNMKDDGGISRAESGGSSTDYDVVAGYPPPVKSATKSRKKLGR